MVMWEGYAIEDEDRVYTQVRFLGTKKNKRFVRLHIRVLISHKSPLTLGAVVAGHVGLHRDRGGSQDVARSAIHNKNKVVSGVSICVQFVSRT